MLSSAPVLPLPGQGYSHGTAAALIVSPDSIVAAIDSREVDLHRLNDGTTVREEHLACKVRQTGPYYVMIAGITRDEDGFDSLQAASAVYRDGDSLEDYASRLEDEIPVRLAPVLNALHGARSSVFDQIFNGDAIQIALIGADSSGRHAIVLSFRATLLASGRIAILPLRSTCPGDCPAGASVYLMGVHQESEYYLGIHREALRDTSSRLALKLIGIEAESHPEVVGGPATVIRIDRTAAILEQSGVCAGSSALTRAETELDRSIAAVANVVVREDVAQYSRRADGLSAGAIHAVVRVVGGQEQYDWRGEPGEPASGFPTPWCGGELVTMLRATRLALNSGEASLSMDEGFETGPALQAVFHATEADRYWQLMLGRTTYPLAFDGRAWFSPSTGALLRIHWDATDLRLPANAGIVRIEWDETFSTNDISGQPFLTPTRALYRVTYARNSARTDWTETRFSGFRRFGAAESVRFDQVASR